MRRVLFCLGIYDVRIRGFKSFSAGEVRLGFFGEGEGLVL